MSRVFSAFGTAFVAIGFICAPLAALSTFVLYAMIDATRGNDAVSVEAGLVVAMLAALALSYVYKWRYQTAQAVNPAQYHDLMGRLQTAKNLLAISPTRDESTGAARAARSDADSLTAALGDTEDTNHRLLNKPGAGWLEGQRYLEAWDSVYRLEEALLLLVPVEQVVAMANDDKSRLEGSRIPNADSLKSRLEWDVGLLSPPHADAEIGKREISARLDIQAVRRQINRYRGEQWAGLVAERNRTLLAAAFAGVLAYLGMLLVVVSHIDAKALLVAVSFVITGAVVSLLHQLTVVGTAEPGIEDFGQATARLLTATFVSGLIALVGIIVLEGATLTINGVPLLTPFPHWKEIFDWTQNKSGFFFAALFGFAPSLLFDLLQRRADDLKTKLNSSKATGSAHAK